MKIPEIIDGISVEPVGKPLVVKGEKWLTLIPADGEDDRIWEFSLTSGRIIKSRH